MSFHITSGIEPYQQRPVSGHQTGRFRRHRIRTEEYTFALCGQLVVRERGEFRGLSIAGPTMRKPWCWKCVAGLAGSITGYWFGCRRPTDSGGC